jgi:hypothetical protein
MVVEAGERFDHLQQRTAASLCPHPAHRRNLARDGWTTRAPAARPAE